MLALSLTMPANALFGDFVLFSSKLSSSCMKSSFICQQSLALNVELIEATEKELKAELIFELI